MTDPFAALRTPDVPVDPDPEFAARLRARLERALALPKGVTPMSTTTETRAGAGVITPYLAVADARGAIDWYRSVFGADLVGEPIIMPDGRVGHAELAIGTARLYLSDAHPEIGVVAPQLDAGSSVTLHLETADVDGTTERARTAAATIEREPADSPYGRMSGMRDPFGHRWMLNGPVATTRPVTGDLGYFALWVDDVERADAFYGHVLDWRFTVDDSGRRRVADTPYRTELVSLAEMRSRAWPDRTRPTAFCAYQVDDVDAAVARVRAAGGTAQAARYGADCSDDQGLAFAIFADDREYRDHEVAYLTVEVASIDAAEAFYSDVFGWRFRPGSIPEGRQIEGPSPMTGFAGGHAEATVVPMFPVADIGAAVARVRAAGGSASDPERYPYGITSECTDDQGLRFYLGELD